jgi:hypothetical protein
VYLFYRGADSKFIGSVSILSVSIMPFLAVFE